ncbi:MAG: complex I subunit 1 family protein [Chthoniobacteraceae bacterium]
MPFLDSIPWAMLAWSVAKAVFVIFLVVLPMVSYTVYAERRVSAAIQDRVGPNRTGFPTTLLGFKKDLQLFLGGLGQPIADAVKFILKEDFTPGGVKHFYFWLAPCLAMLPLVSLAFVPFGSSLFGEKMVIADINVSVLGVFAVTGVGVYAIVIAGWASNSKYPFLGGIRSSSQMIAYELSMGMSIIPVLMAQGTMQMSHIVQNQADNGWTLLPLWGHGLSLQSWLLLIPFGISFIIFAISVFAETNRLPFDMPESESELVSGYHTEYSSMKFALFFLGEYTAMIVGSSLVVVFFLGGWHMPGIPDGDGNGGLPILRELPHWILGLINITCFFGKVAVLLVCFIWVRWTLPRFRFDQVMKLGWLYLFEIALVNIFITAAILAFTSK